jgi:8-oxo-dGTP pyrophosphatase MutT (NUDIX family)
MAEALPKTSNLFLREENRVLLAMKKRGFGVGLWNGVGGKPEVDEPIDDTAVRECQEEILVTPLALVRVALVNCYFAKDGPNAGSDQTAHIYFSHEWDGMPTETEEMRPQWFPEDGLPYESMWSYAPLLLPPLLTGERLEASFFFDRNNVVANYSLRPIV